jgi:hypothetical protein
MRIPIKQVMYKMFQVMRVLHAKVTPSSSATHKSTAASEIVSSALRTAASSPHSAEREKVSKGHNKTVKTVEPSHLHSVAEDHGEVHVNSFTSPGGKTKLADLHETLNIKISRSWVYMVCCGLLMIGLVVIALVLGLDIQYSSPELMVVYQLMVLFDILKTLCEIKILSVSIASAV